VVIPSTLGLPHEPVDREWVLTPFNAACGTTAAIAR